MSNERPVKKVPAKKTATRKKRRAHGNKKNYVSYERAKQIIANVPEVVSRSTYFKWHKDNEITDLPKNPDRVYTTEWAGWGEFTNTGNKSNAVKGQMTVEPRPYWEAVRWAQSFCKLNDIGHGKAYKDKFTELQTLGQIPLDIPRHPDNVYPEWSSWDIWCGKNVVSRVDAERKVPQILAICRMVGSPNNVIDVRHVHQGGESNLLNVMQSQQLIPLRLYEVHRTELPNILELLRACGFSRGDNRWIIPNLYYLLGELDFELEGYEIKNKNPFREYYNTINNQMQNIMNPVQDSSHVIRLSGGDIGITFPD